ncbi:MAG: hypothetical protein IJ799_05440, partial [Bacteroidales bacterium]|nr:hypothetical protein [Bacteroidales bacterium]
TPDDPVEVVSVEIDGDFSDWDAITEELAAKDNTVAILKADDSKAPIQLAKTTSDASNVYFYFEMLLSELPQSAICAEWGDSWNGAAGFNGDENNDAVGENFNLFFDPDGDASTGFLTYSKTVDEDLVPAIAGLGCEMNAQNRFFFNRVTQKLGVAWNQTNIGPTQKQVGDEVVAFDYTGTYFQGSDRNGGIPAYGWQNANNDGTGDNLAPKPENIDSKLDGKIVKIEFAFEKADIVNLKGSDKEYAFGVCWRKGAGQDFGPIRAQYK